MNLTLSGTFEGKEFIYPVRVYFSDTDAGGVVYHSRYLDFAEHARSEFMRNLGGSQQTMMKNNGSVFVIRSVSADYIKPARLDDFLTVRTEVVKCANVTVVFRQRVMLGDDLLCSLQIKAGYISLKEGRPVPMPKEWKSMISSMVVEKS
ncbi:MAG: tol-pal system-associated acyl-CoA thioesterase [Candidatus Brocadiales bacterium]|nr:tol-pal system-associated acyl-CoA thioesterase [Candidatus Brocadiales bacterium]